MRYSTRDIYREKNKFHLKNNFFKIKTYLAQVTQLRGDLSHGIKATEITVVLGDLSHGGSYLSKFTDNLSFKLGWSEMSFDQQYLLC